MKEGKDKFTELMKEKLESFELPYNESHWSEMNELLDKMPPAQKPSNPLGNKYIWLGAAGILALASWLYFDQDSTSVQDQPELITQEETINGPIIQEVLEDNLSSSDEISKPDVSANASIQNELADEEEHGIESPKQEAADEKLDKYADFSESQLKKEGLNELDEIIENDKASYVENEPMINNVELKTQIVLDKKVICTGEEVKFSVDRTIEGANYYWDFGDGDLKSRKMNPGHVFKKAGVFTVRLNVSKGQIGSKNDWQSTLEVTVRKSPEIEILSEGNLITLNDPYARFEVDVDRNCEVKWTFNHKENSKGAKASFLIPKENSYPVEVECTDEYGCSTVSTYHYLSKGSVEIKENAFSPNGDGLNDGFMPEKIQISDVAFALLIMNRNGQVVYQTDDRNSPWNGRVNNTGELLPTGAYHWKLIFTDDRGEKHEQKGLVTITR